MKGQLSKDCPSIGDRKVRLCSLEGSDDQLGNNSRVIRRSNSSVHHDLRTTHEPRTWPIALLLCLRAASVSDDSNSSVCRFPT